MSPYRDPPAAAPRRRFYRSWLAFRLALWCYLFPGRARRALARAGGTTAHALDALDALGWWFRLPPPVAASLLYVVVGVVITCGGACHDLQPAVDATNAARDVGEVSAAVIDRECTQRYRAAAGLEPAAAGAEVLRLDRAGCPAAARAHDAYRAAHRAAVASLQAVQAGRCPAGATEPACDTAAALAGVVDAAAELGAAIARIDGGTDRGAP